MKNILKLFKSNYHPQLIESMLKSNFSGAIIVNIFLPIIVTYLYYDFIPSTQLKLWLGSHIVIFVLRVSLQKKITTNLSYHLILMSGTSLLYAILAWQSLLYSDQIHLLLAAMIIASIVAGSIATLVSVYHIFAIFVMIQMLGLISAFLYVNIDIFYLSAVMATSFLHLVLTNGYKQYKTIKETLRLNQQVNTLLNNTGEGFLSFNKEFKCQSSFSSECERIFQTSEIEGVDIRTLLFNDDTEKSELFRDVIERSIASQDKDTIDIFLSLLPQEVSLYNTELFIEYKYLNKGLFMLIMRDVTQTNRLKSKIEYQNKVQNLLINVASNRNDFIDLKDSFEKLISRLYTHSNNSLSIIESIKQELHTFKGNFSQKRMIYIPNYIHQLELKIKNLSSSEEIISTCIEANLKESFNKDIAVINAALGEEYLNAEKTINVKVTDIDVIELDIKSFVCKFDLEQQIALNTLLQNVHRLKYLLLKDMLTPYIDYIDQMALKLEKEINPLKIIGNESLKISPRLALFMKQLIHLFNNALDHGIETSLERELSQKNPMATISCEFSTNADILILKVSDDGRGINLPLLVDSAIKNETITVEESLKMSDEEKCALIFEERLSSKEKITTLSGIGIGMSAVKNELDNLNGRFLIESKEGDGVSFTFYLPLNTEKNVYLCYEDSNVKNCEGVANAIITQIEHYLKETIKTTINNVKKEEEISLANHYSSVDLNDGYKGKVILIYSDELLDTFTQHMLPDGYDAQEHEEILLSVGDEVINTIVGISLQYFDKALGQVDISPPLPMAKEELLNSIDLAKARSIYTLQTNKGTLSLVVLDE